MGLFGGGSKGEFELIPLTKEQQAAEKYIQGLMERDLEFPMREIADLSPIEQAILKQYQDTLGSDKGAMQSVMNMLMSSVRGEYDPTTSPYYKGMRKEFERMKQKGIGDVTRRGQLLTGAPSSDMLRETGNYANMMDEASMQVLGNLFEQERNRQMQSSQQVTNLQNQLMQAGGLPRSLRQEQLDAAFNQAMSNLVGAYQYQMPAAQAIYDKDRYTYVAGEKGSSLLGDIGGMVGIASKVKGAGGLGSLVGGILG